MPLETDQKPAEKKRWTVMLFMAASQDERTEQAAIRDIRELEDVTRVSEGLSKTLNVLVQIDRNWPGYAERYCIKEGQSSICSALGQKNIDSGKPEVLREFVKWSRNMFPADYYLLVLWGHSYGLGFGRDHDDALTLPEIAASLDRQELNKVLNVLIPDDGKAVDILGANACAMSYAEAAFELQDGAHFMVAPEITMPFQGWPYDRILSEIVEDPGITPKKLGPKIVEQFMASFREAVEPRNVSLTLLDLREAKKIDKYLHDLATEVTAAIDSQKHRTQLQEQIADAFLDTAHGDERPLIDLFDLCGRLSAIDPEELLVVDRKQTRAVIGAAKAFRDFLERGGKLVVDCQVAQELEGIHGVGIFAPSVSGAAELMRLSSSEKRYKQLKLMKANGMKANGMNADNAWAKLAYEDLKGLLNPVNKIVAEFVNGTGATNREDRLGVAQLLVSVHRSFVRLEKTLADTQEKVIGALNGNGAVKSRGAKNQESQPAGMAFGPPYLRLITDLGPPSYPSVLPKKPGTAVRTTDAAKNDRLLKTVASLAKLEDALTNVERTAKRVMTHARLGLGSPKDDLGSPKDDLGSPKDDLGSPKDDLGSPKDDLGSPKDDLGSRRSDIGILPWLMTQDGGYASNGTRVVTAFYRQVAWSLQLLEEGVAKVENEARAVLTTAPSGSTARDYGQRTTEQLKQSFRGLHELVSNARLTTVSVLAHPAHGLGPGPQGSVGSAGRQQLAIAGGLSSRSLRLL